MLVYVTVKNIIFLHLVCLNFFSHRISNYVNILNNKGVYLLIGEAHPRILSISRCPKQRFFIKYLSDCVHVSLRMLTNISVSLFSGIETKTSTSDANMVMHHLLNTSRISLVLASLVKTTQEPKRSEVINCSHISCVVVLVSISPKKHNISIVYLHTPCCILLDTVCTVCAFGAYMYIKGLIIYFASSFRKEVIKDGTIMDNLWQLLLDKQYSSFNSCDATWLAWLSLCR